MGRRHWLEVWSDVALEASKAHRVGRMALIHQQADLSPSKIEVLTAWVPVQPWLGGADTSSLEAVCAYRFDDPDGEVGVETHLLRTADGQLLQVPLTYRGASMAGAESSLIATMQHSVLGERWVYDGCGDPVYAKALATAVLTGGTQAELEFATETGTERRKSTTRVWGSGSPGSAVPAFGQLTCTNEGATTVIRAGELELVVLRVIDAAALAGTQTLVGTWPGHDAPALLAFARAN